MSVNPKEKAALQKLWDEAKSASSEVADGTYQFLILAARFNMSQQGRPQFKTKVRVVGGAEEYVGKELEINDNLETPLNMSFFKKKLTRLNIAPPEDLDEVIDGTLAAQMEGKKFEGQVKTKNDFMNVYVNRLLGEQKIEDEGSTEEERPAEKEDTGAGIDVGDAVKWPGHTGEVVEVLDDGKARVKDAEDGKVYRVAIDKLVVLAGQEENEGAEEAEGQAETNGDSLTLPSAEEVDSLPAGEVKKVLGLLGIDAGKIKQPRAVLHGIATLAADHAAKIELTEIAPMSEALGVMIKKGTAPRTALAEISKAVQSLIGAE